MIGCGQVIDEQWEFKQFTVDRLDVDSEATAIGSWVDHMTTVADGRPTTLFHWSFAEPVFLDTAYNNARDRHPEHSWPNLKWYDLYSKVFNAEPVVVKGAWGLGLKAVARAMKSHGLIETTWGEGLSDGMGATVAAWHTDAEAKKTGDRLIDQDLMQEVADYNEVDCKVMHEILNYLRRKH